MEKLFHMNIRRLFLVTSAIVLLVIIGLAVVNRLALWSLVVVGPIILLGLHDVLQSRHSLLRNFPLLGHGRYFMEAFRPEIYQYFVESNTNGSPFSRQFRSIAYQRAKGELGTHPFGTESDVYEGGYEWMPHSMEARHLDLSNPRIKIGGPSCTQPYMASVLNISAMSFGSLSSNAIQALNQGAALGEFAHNTGEGGLSNHHERYGGDLVWQIGTGYFGCRNQDGSFDLEAFAEKASRAQVKMIEVKLSQGAKPGHGGILPAGKVTPEISKIRGVPMGRDVLSPPTHSAFDTPVGMLEFLRKLEERSGGKPVGIKLCIGSRVEFLSICKAMQETGLSPSFITVDGGEGGTGAAPLEFSNSVGMPLREALVFVQNALRGIDRRDSIRLIAAGKIITAFHMVRAMALGADLCNSARGMMFALGCIQAQKCNSNICPVGIATQNDFLAHGLVVGEKAVRVASFHRETVAAFVELLGAAGLSSPGDITPDHVMRRIDNRAVKSYRDCYEHLAPGALIHGPVPQSFVDDWQEASPQSFRVTRP